MGRLWRVHHPGLSADPGRQLILDGEQAHHLLRVLRLREGERVGVFDGAGEEWRAVLLGADGGRVTLELEERLEDRVEPPLELELFQAFCRPDRFEWVIQKGTEIGLSAVHAFPANRCEARAPGPGRLERWRRIGIEACKQSGRRRLPGIDVRRTLDPPPGDGTLAIVLDPRADAPPLAEAAGGPPPPGIWLAVGPESGFDLEEVEALSSRGWQRAGLGPRVLRADTAGLVAASILLHRWGDLGTGPAA